VDHHCLTVSVDFSGRCPASPRARECSPPDSSAWRESRPPGGTRAPPRTAAVADAAGKAAAYDRWRILGNAVVPDTVRLAFFHLLTLGRVTELADGPATFVESTGALVANGTKGLAVARDGAKVFVRAHGAMRNKLATPSCRLKETSWALRTMCDHSCRRSGTG
jgi:hypothetical protein